MLTVRGMTDKRRTAGNQCFPMDKVCGRITDKRISFVFRGQAIPAIDRDTTGRSKLIGVQIGGRPGRTDRVELRFFTRSRNILNRGFDRKRRIASREMIFDDDMLQGVSVRTDKTIPKVIKTKSKLAMSRDSTILASDGIKPKIKPRQRQRLSRFFPLGLHRDHRTPAKPVRNVDKTIGTKRGMIRPQLRIFLRKPLKPSLMEIRFSILVPVGKKGNLASQRDNHPVSPRQHSRGKQQFIGEDRCRFKSPIMIMIEQPLDA